MLAVVSTAVPKLRPALRGKAPDLSLERRLWEEGHAVVVGMDEVGRGAWAGPLTVGAAVVPRERRIYKVRDSKLLTPTEREALFERVAEWCSAWAVGHATHEECDELGMSEAQRLAARRALEALGTAPDRVLVDGKWDFVGGGIVEKIPGGDLTSLSIASASVLAKVTRDRSMLREADQYPGYNFALNKGYPCPVHKAALCWWGPTAIHRRSWAFMEWIPWSGLARYQRPDPQGRLFEDA